MSPLLTETLNAIVIELARGVAPWRKPWTSAARPTRPLRADGQAFSGMNAILLSTLQASRGFVSSHWLTYNQALERGGQVRKGERAAPALLYKTRVVEGEEAGESDDRVLRFLKCYAVFNAEQIEGLPEDVLSKPGPDPEVALSEDIERIRAGFPVPVTYGGDRACYYWLTDRITMPYRASFDSDADFVATLLHEFAHATGAKSRLDRFPTSDCMSDYAREELVAELASHLLSLQLGVSPSQAVFRNHVAYIDHWAQFLKDRPTELLKAAGKAQAATDFILQFCPSAPDGSERDAALAA